MFLLYLRVETELKLEITGANDGLENCEKSLSNW